MKTSIRSLFLLAAFACFAEANINCAGAVAVAFIPLIGAENWHETTNSTHTFTFIVDKPDSNVSDISGNEFENGVQYPFTGSYQNYDLHFVYTSDAGTKKGKGYNGKVNNASTEISLTSNDGLPALTLIK